MDTDSGEKMKVYLTSVGERTTELVLDQWHRFGFNVVLMDKKEKWITKYKKFINKTEGDCIRADADVIPNKKMKDIQEYKSQYPKALMLQFKVFDFYKNDLHTGGPIWYSKEVIQLIKDQLDQLSEQRPETAAWRLKSINPKTFTIEEVVGQHGFYQDKEAIERARQNKINRDQMREYDFELVDKVVVLNA